MQQNLLSIIVPTLNEEQLIASTLVPLQNLAGVEILVVDGGSTDTTVAVVKELGIKVIPSESSRAKQMNTGAEVARGDTLLFLHADTRLPKNFQETIDQTLAVVGVVAGAFLLSIYPSSPGLRIVETCANLRSRYLNLPYGDQAIFLRKETFESVGGYPELHIMEDYEIVKRLRQIGKISIAPKKVFTSARRWEKHGILRTTFNHQLALLAYVFGLPSDKVAKIRKS